MTDTAPDRISISPVHRKKREDDFYLVDRRAFPGKGTEYIRADLHEAEVAALKAENQELTLKVMSQLGQDCDLLVENKRLTEALEGLVGPHWEAMWTYEEQT